MTRFISALYLAITVMIVQTSEARVIDGGLVNTFHLGRSGFLQPRQGAGAPPEVPAQCQTNCTPINTVLASPTGCSVSTCCQISFETGYFNCFQCVAEGLNLTDYTTPQMFLDDLFDQCAADGIALTKLTFPGQNPNRQLSSVVGGSSSTQASSGTVSTSTQSTITAITSTSLTPTIIQNTITALPTTTAPATSPAPTSSYGIKTISNQHLNFALVASSLFMGLVFYLGL